MLPAFLVCISPHPPGRISIAVRRTWRRGFSQGAASCVDAQQFAFLGGRPAVGDAGLDRISVDRAVAQAAQQYEKDLAERDELIQQATRAAAAAGRLSARGFRSTLPTATVEGSTSD